MTWGEITWEGVKLLSQAVTALVVARLAVRWALSRFKQERVWERQLAAQSDILIALAELRRLYGRWIDELQNHSKSTEDAEREHNERYRVAKRKLEEAMPLAQLLLPAEVTRVLNKLEEDRENLYTGDQYDDFNRHYSLLNGAISKLVQDGRQLLP